MLSFYMTYRIKKGSHPKLKVITIGGVFFMCFFSICERNTVRFDFGKLMNIETKIILRNYFNDKIMYQNRAHMLRGAEKMVLHFTLFMPSLFELLGISFRLLSLKMFGIFGWTLSQTFCKNI